MATYSYSFHAMQRCDEALLHAEVEASGLPGFLGISGPEPDVSASFDAPLTPGQINQLLALGDAHSPPPRRRLRQFSAVRADIFGWFAIPAGAPVYVQRMGAALAADLAYTLLRDPQLAARVSIPIDPTEVDPNG